MRSTAVSEQPRLYNLGTAAVPSLPDLGILPAAIVRVIFPGRGRQSCCSSLSACHGRAQLYEVSATICLVEHAWMAAGAHAAGCATNCQPLTCPICLEAVPSCLSYIAGACGHAFCLCCLKDFVRHSLLEHRYPMTSPGSACSSTIHPDDLLKLLEGDDLYQLIIMVGTLLGSLRLESMQAALISQQ